jgi:hypothetical protein
MKLPGGDQTFLSQWDPAGRLLFGSSDAHAGPAQTKPTMSNTAVAAARLNITALLFMFFMLLEFGTS